MGFVKVLSTMKQNEICKLDQFLYHMVLVNAIMSWQYHGFAINLDAINFSWILLVENHTIFAS